ncbi:MAG: DUF418 domain-containing protein [Pedobacter sp.]|uniref:DUF418 domain-containing protein n=1 Tax=Pedobacter sp. TaxID=1411316 RepID=UPI00280923DD|nr:DUF418 domain-containing protein [Pedobacter sp.]MDQ8003691.1 DUF418 domain-containing protein [Pedobacter sp.]
MTTTNSSRIQTIDQIRGIALLGILIFNVQTYTFYAFLRPEQVYSLGLDQPETYGPAQFLISLLVKGQFYTIYSFLFGLGFYLMWQKNNQTGLNADKLFKRRLWSLLLIGLIHAFVFWFGDILHKYAILGFSLIYFNRKSVRYLFKWIAGLLVFMLLIQFVLAIFLPVTPQSIAANNKEFDKVIMEVLDTWKNGTMLQVISLQKLGVAMGWFRAISNGMISLIHFEILFLLGLIAGKTNVFGRIKELGGKLLKWAFIILPFGLAIKAIANLDPLQIKLLPNQPTWEIFIQNISESIGSLLLTFVYLVLLTSLLSKSSSKVQVWIGSTGRLGLTNYLAQTLICMLLFYGYALGLGGKITLLQSVVTAILIYVFQIIYSNIWFKYYKIGPMEKLWRRMTYGENR